MSRFSLTVWLVAVVFAASTAVAASPWKKRKRKAEEEVAVDHVSLAAVMVKDGHYDRAAAVLGEVVPEEQPEDFDLARFHMLFGLVHLKRSEYGAAEESFEASVDAGQKEPVVHVFMAQARFGLQDYEGTIESLDSAGKAADDLAGTFMLRARSYYKLENKPAAYRALERGLALHPGDLEIERYRVLLLVDMGLFQEAVEKGRAFLYEREVGAEDYAAICEALIKGGDAGSAVLLLEEARLRYPQERKVTLQLARAYLKLERPLTAARLFNSLSVQDPALTLDTAELYRRAGRLTAALALNADVADQEAKIRQRLGILIEMGRYEEAASLEPRLARLGLLEENAVRYALAFALFKTGRFDRSERHLELVRDPALFEKAVELRKAMDRCRAAGWECR